VIALPRTFNGTSASKGEDRRTVGGREREEYEEPLLTAHENLHDITGKAPGFYGEAKDFAAYECPILLFVSGRVRLCGSCQRCASADRL